MGNRRVFFGVWFVAFCLAVTLGMLDRETESIEHLFTAELGNLAGLAMYTVIFAVIGLGVVGAIKLTFSSANQENS